uniref:Uncharacterized protein n=1 Tax=Anguilla anguilla TaxID=7936 RepID=A0A0E9URV1_ANGAN
MQKSRLPLLFSFNHFGMVRDH